ncbi:hypothetical protein Tco_1310793 [Tanacetum coccineum]
MLTMAENVIVAGADNRPPMLDKTQYSFWRSLAVLEIPTTPATIRDRTYDELINTKKIHEACDIKATNIILQGLPQDIYNLVNHHTDAKEIWDRVKLLIEGSELSLQERESKLYDELDRFTSEKGETIHSYYLRFAQLINDMHTIAMSMKPLQINTKFINQLQPGWSKFVTDVKLAKDLHNTKFDHFSSLSYTNQTSYHQHLSPIAQQYYSSPAQPQSNDIPMVQQRSYQPPVANHSSVGRQTQGYACNGARINATGIWVNINGGTNIASQAKEIPNPTIFQTDDLDAFDSNCDEAPLASVVLMAKLSAYDSDVLLEVLTHDTYLYNHVIDQSVQEMRYSEQPPFDNQTDFDITSDSNVISYEQYLKETKNTVVQDTNSYAQQDAMIMFVNEEMSNQVAKCNEEDKKHDALSVMDTEETLILAEESRIKMHAKQTDPNANDKKINIIPIDYAALNKLSEHFVKHFVPKKLSIEQAFRLPIPKPVSKTPPVQSEPVLKEIPCIAKEITNMKEVFTQMEIEVAKCSIERKYFEIEKKEFFIETDRILEHIICQDVMCIVMHTDIDTKCVVPANDDNLDYAEIEKSYIDEYSKVLELKGKGVSDSFVPVNSSKVIALGMYKLDLELLSPLIRKNMDAHLDYLKETRNNADIPRDIELLVYVGDTCPDSRKGSKKVVSAKPMNKRVKYSTSASGSQPSGNTKKNRISRITSSNQKYKGIQIVLWYLDSGCSENMIGQPSQLINFVSKFIGTIRFGNDHVAAIMGYQDYQIGNAMISKVYYVEALGYNLLSVGQFCDSDHEVAFQKHTCFVRDLEGVDLLKGSRGTNLYTMSLE